MAHRPTLYIGIGGSGCKTLSLIKNNFMEKYGDGKIPEHIRFFCVDSEVCLDEALVADTYVIGHETMTPKGYLDLNISRKTGLCDWYLDNDQASPTENVLGVGASRAYARLALEASNKNILAKIRTIISELLDAAHGSGSVDIDVRFVMSLAGGTGSGIFIPLAMLVSQFKAVNLYGYAILHGIYRKSDPGGPVYKRAFANSYASILELDYLQHASEDNQIKMSVGGIDCILKAPLFKGFYMVEHLNNAGKIIQNVQDMYNVLALSMFSSSFEASKDMAPDNAEGIYDIKDKKGWLGSIGACEIIFNGEKFVNLYSHKIAHNIICQTLASDTYNWQTFPSFINYGSLNLLDAQSLTKSLQIYMGLTAPRMLMVENADSYTTDCVVKDYLAQQTKDTLIEEDFAENATHLKSYLPTIGNCPQSVRLFLEKLIEHCQEISATLTSNITDIQEKIDVNTSQLKTHLYKDLEADLPFLRRRVRRNIELRAYEIAKDQHSLILNKYGLDMMNALITLAEKYKGKIDEYSQTLLRAKSHLNFLIKDLEEHLNSSSSPFVYDTTVMYWKEFAKDDIPGNLTVDLLNNYLNSGFSVPAMINHILQHINSLYHVSCYSWIPLESIIIDMGDKQYQAMMRFVRTSAIRMLMLDGRGYMINDQMAVDCMTRHIVISMYGDHKFPAMEADLQNTWKLWDNCQTNIAWNKVTDEDFRQRAIIAVHEGNIIPYCVDAFYPDIVQKEYTETIEKGIYNPHIDAILYERMQLASHSLKPVQATIAPEAKEALANPAKSSRKHQDNEKEKPIINVFIAGSKELRDERDLIRVELSKLANTFNLDIRPHSFEDFKSSLKGQSGGRQADYNRFIRDEADVVVFIFDSRAGSITEEEFDVAYDSLAENRRPDIFVYGRNMSNDDPTLKKIKERIFSYGQEYYIEYTSRDDLRYQFYKDMVFYLK